MTYGAKTKMQLVLSTYSLAALGGSETYLLTLAGELERLGHDVSLHAKELGEDGCGRGRVARAAGV